jgi:hypothetical protein
MEDGLYIVRSCPAGCIAFECGDWIRIIGDNVYRWPADSDERHLIGPKSLLENIGLEPMES